MENEDAFAAEAQDDAVLSRRRQRGLAVDTPSYDRQNPDLILRDNNEAQGESSPLLPDKSATSRAISSDRSSSESYARAINQPWLGARESDGLPWYKKPSV